MLIISKFINNFLLLCFHLNTDILVKLTRDYSEITVFIHADISCLKIRYILAYAKESRADPTHLQTRIHCGSESVYAGVSNRRGMRTTEVMRERGSILKIRLTVKREREIKA